MTATLRAASVADAPELGRILYSAFRTLADHHNFPRDFPSVGIATAVVGMLLGNPGFYGVVAETDGRIVGSNFIDLRSPIAGIGPVSVDPSVQNKGLGRMLMQAVMAEARARGVAGMRLVQAAYHNRSLCLYTKLGFATRETLSVMQGAPLHAKFPGYDVRLASAADLSACDALCRRLHGFERGGELRDAVSEGSATVVEHDGRITGYATDVAIFGHAVAEANEDLQALIGAAPAFTGPGFLVPTRNLAMMEWCFDRGLRLVLQMTLMTIGAYSEPRGAYLPSVLF